MAQNGGAYKSLGRINDNTSQGLRYWGGLTAQKNAQDKAAYQATEQQRSDEFQQIITQAINAYNNGNYTRCVDYYSQSKGLGFYHSSLELVAGVSYYYIFKQTNKKKYRKMAKKALKLSKRHGNVDADIFLEKHFK